MAGENCAKNQRSAILIELGNQLDVKTANIKELETQIAKLQTQNENLNRELQGYVGTDGTLSTIDTLLVVAADYIESGDIYKAAEELEVIAQNINIDATSEAFQKLYNTLLGSIGPELSQTYFRTGAEAFRTEDYATAIENYLKAVYYDAANADALYELGNTYRRSEDSANAIITYDKVIELFPDTDWARKSKRYRDDLAGGSN